jgi:general secretion pathway protein J
LAQWTADLESIAEYPPTTALEWNGRVLRLTRRSSIAPADGVKVVGWTRRQGQWLRWESPAVTTRGDLDAAWLQADLWSQNPSDAMRRQEVAIGPLEDWQIFFYRNDSWTNPMSSDASSSAQPPESGSPLVRGLASARASNLPDGVRLVLQLPPGRAITGQLLRDWVRPTVGGGKS